MAAVNGIPLGLETILNLFPADVLAEYASRIGKQRTCAICQKSKYPKIRLGPAYGLIFVPDTNIVPSFVMQDFQNPKINKFLCKI